MKRKKGLTRWAVRAYAAILAGGVGSRFWPLSRVTTPKQILKVVGDESLLKATIDRLSPLIPHDRVSIVTSAQQAEVIRLHLAQYDRAAGAPGYVVEPMGRNTAAAIGLAAIELHAKDPDAVMAVLPADHIIQQSGPFREALKAAVAAAAEGLIVTFGIVPDKPETGYGYIKALPGGRAINGLVVRPVERFVEKPDLKRAKAFLKAGGYYWNSGIFVWRVSRILEEIERHLPKTHAALMEIKGGSDIKKAYAKMDSISIDHGVLEKTRNAAVIPVDFGWSDMGSWTSFAEIFPKDGSGNIVKGRVVDVGNRDSVILGCDRVVAAVGLKDMIVVDTPDATLVCPKDRAQEVKEVVDILKKRGYVEHEEHKTVERPWGSYTLHERGEGYKIKKITVLPGRRLSLQMHRQRSEHWVVIAGVARVQRGDEVVELGINQSTYIPKGVRHRLENPGKETLEIIEVQSGPYVEEDDIVRFEDDFARPGVSSC